MKNEGLKSGFTTGACSASASKAALESLLTQKKVSYVEIPFPQGFRHGFNIHKVVVKKNEASASVIKYAGDDPDVTNGAEIVATVRFAEHNDDDIIITGGDGVGIVTKPGLAVQVGQPAINPIPQQMIKEAIRESLISHNLTTMKSVQVCISIPNGQQLAKKTLNYRLGIVGGLSILGTTGIVKPLSTEAWTSTIKSSMDVAKALNREDVVLSTGRTSEKAHMLKYSFPEECYVMMGDYLDYAITEATRHCFKSIHLCAQWAKMLKIALGNTNTNVSFGVIQLQEAMKLINKLWLSEFSSNNLLPINTGYPLNTARELYGLIDTLPLKQSSKFFQLFLKYVTHKLNKHYGVNSIITHLVTYDGQVISFCQNT
ncbi:MAG: cobalt-precorrin-5B (C(1))-methyltransferase CbiD [Thermodesulfovibrionales bacterium]|nr:cobalt-precorrin-5B (C(1))-methyltransferase CbiD [Thermodesulfovibrionales bacterium]